MMDVFTQYFDTLSPILLDDVLSQLLWCVQQGRRERGREGRREGWEGGREAGRVRKNPSFFNWYIPTLSPFLP